MTKRRGRGSRTAIIAIAAIAGLLIGGCGSGDGEPSAAIPSTPGIGTPQEDTSASEIAAKVPDADQRAEVARVLRLIASGQALPYEQDGSVFGNREGNLPGLPSNLLYREYTVPTPGSPDRGARRLVIGDDGSVYYTSDHYSSFVRLDQ